MESRIVDLETKLAYQEHLLEELNKVMTEQQGTIDGLIYKVDSLNKAFMAMADNGIKDVSDEEPPPHY